MLISFALKILVMVKRILFLLLTITSALMTSAEQLYVNSKNGNDANSGTQLQPVKTIAEAARRINASYKKEAATIYLAEGVYPLSETVLFNNNKFTAENRLVIRAEVMPDEPGWTPQRMPVIAMIMPTLLTPKDGEESKGLQIEVSHATIEGLRFTGSPVYYYIDAKQDRRPYPIWREGKNLDDLLVTQCLFAGNVDVLPIRVAIIANGQGLVVDHCIFFGCQNSVVFWDAEGGLSSHNAMRYCLVYGSNYSGVWTTGNTADDFEFHHNIIAGTLTAWISDKSGHHYSAHDCIFAGNTFLTKYGNEAGVTDTISGSGFLKTTNVQLIGHIEIEKDQSKNNYLQLKEGAFGSELKAGLFKK
jgi:hypothetical protein